jgi:hypothetical protein
MVARFQTNSPVSWILATLSFQEVDAKPMIRVIAEAVEETIRREIDVALTVARGDPADRPRRDDGVEGIVLEAVALGGFVVVQVFRT